MTNGRVSRKKDEMIKNIHVQNMDSVFLIKLENLKSLVFVNSFIKLVSKCSVPLNYFQV